MMSRFQHFSIIYLLLFTACRMTSQPTQAAPLTASIPSPSLTTTSVPQDSTGVNNSALQDMAIPSASQLPPGQAIISTVLPQQFVIPPFTVPDDWLLFTNSYPTYKVYYPPNANLATYMPAQRLTIDLPAESDMHMLQRQLAVEARSAPAEGCFHLSGEFPLPTTNGMTQINGVDFVYVEDLSWHPLLPGGSQKWDIFQSYYVTSLPKDGFCYSIVLQMLKLANSDVDGAAPLPTPSLDTSIEILLEMLSTFQLF